MMKLEMVLIEDWRKMYKMYSVWFFALLMAMPELYNAAITAGLITQDQVPGFFSKIVSLVSFLGLCSRIVAQKQTTISALPEEEQAKVALGLETQEDALANAAKTAAAPAPKPIAEVVISEEQPPAAPPATP